jgi:hypothetical protein
VHSVDLPCAEQPAAGRRCGRPKLTSSTRDSRGKGCGFNGLQVEDATDYVSQQVGDAQRSIEEKRAHAQQSLEQYQKVRGFMMQCLPMRVHICGAFRTGNQLFDGRSDTSTWELPQ